ncbi:RIP metalloprotease RseP [Inmirania thermothiophila]|uniref:Zinc metalloprotease n=1 Tax=Inmirania thermothiophila TaxID=1750597 RepID=A0A3N1Y107_9GAMM|nr:RIP metalloprotease RseP [Inmirania thermothiophila]ROR32221.1 regulator of sigma E protease [Inmirania thermothiophila]
MGGILFTLASFTVALAILIAVHEFGHFWVARRLGVRVLRFSIGFGRPLWRRQGADGTEYVVAVLPLGGYVKMLDEHEGPVPPAERHRAFNNQPLWRRSAIVLAGPVFNLLFALVAYWVIHMAGVTGLRPVLGPVPEGTPAAQAGLAEGDEIVAVGGRRTPTWDAAMLALLDRALAGEAVRLRVRRAGGGETALELALPGLAGAAEGELDPATLGLVPWQPRMAPVIDRVVPGGAAEAAGLEPGDEVLAADGVPMPTWQAWVDYVRARPGQPIRVRVRRGEAVVELEVTPEAGEDGVGRIGAYVRIPEGVFEAMRVEVRYGPVAAAREAAAKTGRMIGLMVRLLGRMALGQASVENLSGPISIAQYAGQSAAVGLVPFLSFLAVVSISLGIINLAPIPLLDGGHLLYYLIEAVKGSPLSEQAQMLGQRVGIAVLLALMGLAFYNDLARLLG